MSRVPEAPSDAPEFRPPKITTYNPARIGVEVRGDEVQINLLLTNLEMVNINIPRAALDALITDYTAAKSDLLLPAKPEVIRP